MIGGEGESVEIDYGIFVEVVTECNNSQHKNVTI